jgi:hypothetical protein
MSTSSDFLKQMSEAGSKLDSGGGLGCVGRILVEFGFHGYPKVKGSGLDFWFAWRPASDTNDMERAKADCQAKLNEHKADSQARFGIKITIFKDAFTGPYSRDLAEFIPEWSRDGIIYKMVLDTLMEHDIPVNQVFYGQAAYKADPYQVSLGEEGKTATDKDGNLFNPPRYPTIRVPVKIFKDEATAKAFMNDQGGSSDIKWSEVAVKNFGAEGPNDSLQTEIVKWYEEAKAGRAYANDPATYAGLPDKPTENEAKEYICGCYNDHIEPGDIDLMLPF